MGNMCVRGAGAQQPAQQTLNAPRSPLHQAGNAQRTPPPRYQAHQEVPSMAERREAIINHLREGNAALAIAVGKQINPIMSFWEFGAIAQEAFPDDPNVNRDLRDLYVASRI